MACTRYLVALLLVGSLLCATGGFAAGVAVVGNLARHHQVMPGNTFEGVIVLKNTGHSDAEMRILQSDYRFTADGTNHFEKPGTMGRSNATWFSVTPARTHVPAQGSTAVHYSGRVPESGQLSGTYWSTILIEPIPASITAVNGKDDHVTVGLRTVMRYAIQITTDIGETGEQSLEITGKHLLRTEKDTVLEMDISNNGERIQIPAIWAELFDNQGTSIGRFEGGRRRIYPGCSVRYRIDFPGLPNGRYTALIVLDSGGDYVTGAQYTLDITS